MEKKLFFIHPAQPISVYSDLFRPPRPRPRVEQPIPPTAVARRESTPINLILPEILPKTDRIRPKMKSTIDLGCEATAVSAGRRTRLTLLFRAQTSYACRDLKILVAITGASGALYAQRLLDNLNPREHEIYVVLSNYAQQVVAEELPGGLKLPAGARLHNLKSMNAPFASGSNPPDAMVVIPCTMGTMGRIAHGYSGDVLLRAADVTLKEKRKLILVPRETPLSLIHVKNMELLLLAGATVLPANPSFYSGAKTIVELADTVVSRVLDHLGIKNDLAPRWSEEKE
jgi:4-hydroxy-3-polyprenylbenzoate decarboxylase